MSFSSLRKEKILTVNVYIFQELDIAIGPFTITSLREEVIDFTVPFMQDGGGILTKGGDPGPDPLTVFYPLPVAMWLSLGGAVIVTGAVLYVIALSVRRRSLDRDTPEDSPWTFWESVFIVYGSLVEQGTQFSSAQFKTIHTCSGDALRAPLYSTLHALS